MLLTRPADAGVPRLPLTPGLDPVRQLDRTLCEIRERYAASRHEWVLLEMEYAPRQTACTG